MRDFVYRRSWFVALCLFANLHTGCGCTEHPPLDPSSHRLEKGFRNTNPAFSAPKLWDRLAFIVSRVWATSVHPRSIQLPMAESNGNLLQTNRTEATITWVGHSTLLIQLDGVNILTDPQWSNRASPVTFTGPRRVTPPGLAFEQLPRIDVVLISHDHYDHLDVATVTHLAEMYRPLFLGSTRIEKVVCRPRYCRGG